MNSVRQRPRIHLREFVRMNRRALLVVMLATLAGMGAYFLVASQLGGSHGLLMLTDQFRGTYATVINDNLGMALLAYFFLYATVVAFALPLTAIMDVIGGFIFGLIGFPIAILSVCLGSIPPFLIARRLSTVALEHFDSAMVRRVQHGFSRYGFQYLVLMRVVPWAPCSVTTIIAGALGMHVAQFVFGTAIGFLPPGIALNAIGHGLERLGDLDQGSIAHLYKDRDFLFAAAGIAVVMLLSLARRVPLVSRLLG
jgi:uncharacterized membrane protein YdjX (TVP38/TMEM64 family)